MQIHRMTATFGKLQGQTLELRKGLNIIEAPNETGKSTWSAFLLSMLYGINSRERDKAGFIADKNRYAPWDGGAMSGRLDCQTKDEDWTLTRTTRKSSLPMGDFSAVYTGTNEPVSGITAANCGEMLLGVTREVYERSAFIRQSGLAVTPDTELERRIAALITAGDEGVSYSEAAEVLKRQLNRRRRNKSGQLPALEAELAETRRQLAAAECLQFQYSEAAAQAEQLSAQAERLSDELAALERWETAEKRRRLAEAEIAAAEAEQRLRALQTQLDDALVPENDTIARLRGAIVNLETVRRGVEKAREERDNAAKALLRAEAAVSDSPFGGQTPEEAQRDIQPAPATHVPGAIAARELAIFFLFIAGACAAAFLFISRFNLRTEPIFRVLPWAMFAVVTVAGGVLSRLYRRKALAAVRSAALMKRFGTDDPNQIQSLADTYIQLLAARDAAQTEAAARSAAAEGLYNSLCTNEQAILLEIRCFAPSAFTVPAADALLRECAQRRKELAAAETAARDACLRRELLAQQIPFAPPEEDTAPIVPPARSREDITAALVEVRAALASSRSAADNLAGQLHAAGDTVLLRSDEARLLEQISLLEGEFTSLSMAAEALTAANTVLQSRFSPELGKRAAEIFGALTGGRYTGVVLDRAFRLAAEPTGDPLFRDAGLLSAGTLDQLYLAVRLAVCRLVLPQEKAAPLVLDDALANFDDVRATAALRRLKQEARQRQILLFTCHSREAAFFADDGEVFIQRLTNVVERV